VKNSPDARANDWILTLIEWLKIANVFLYVVTVITSFNLVLKLLIMQPLNFQNINIFVTTKNAQLYLADGNKQHLIIHLSFNFFSPLRL